MNGLPGWPGAALDRRLRAPRRQGAAAHLSSPWPLAALAALALCAAPGAAQEEAEEGDAGEITLEGEVIDGVSGLPVAGAIVAIPPLGRSALTDEMGYFRMEDVPVGFYAVSAMRLGYRTFTAELAINGRDVLAFHLDPGPIPLEGIEVRVVGREDLSARALGISSRSVIGPVEMEDLRRRYFSLDQILTSRYLPRARFRISQEPGRPGCLMVSRLTIRGRSCAALVVDGVYLGAEASDWVYRMSSHDIFSVRFLYGPAAALRYGHRGSDGVLLIETRAGGR